MLLEHKIKMFSKELALIKDFSIKKFTIECLDEAPDYIFKNCPSSSTGKYHALDEFSPLGNVLHTKRVVSNCKEMARAFALDGKDYDIVISSAILHDMVKQGFEQTGHTVSNHAELGAKLVETVFNKTKSKISKEDYENIKSCVFFHNGIWTPDIANLSISQFTPHQLCVHMADYSATKFHPANIENDQADVFSELRCFVDDFKIKFRIDSISDIPVLLGKFFGALCSNIKNFSALEEKLMILSAICIKSILYLRLNNKN